jgi:hypothetical protein
MHDSRTLLHTSDIKPQMGMILTTYDLDTYNKLNDIIGPQNSLMPSGNKYFI